MSRLGLGGRESLEPWYNSGCKGAAKGKGYVTKREIFHGARARIPGRRLSPGLGREMDRAGAAV